MGTEFSFYALHMQVREEKKYFIYSKVPDTIFVNGCQKHSNTYVYQVLPPLHCVVCEFQCG